nr:peptide-methionine (S)-S-oxide reductase MsrA [Propionibacterium sp.]
MGLFAKRTLVDPRVALPGRAEPILGPCRHAVFGIDVHDVPEGSEVAYFALGCFWGEEKMFWNTPGVTNTAVGYQGGVTLHPTYEEVCSGRTNHAETVRVCFDPARVTYEALVRQFFEAHDPTQGMRQGNDIGTQYRSVLFPTSDAQAATASAVFAEARERYRAAGYGDLTTEIRPVGADVFYWAEAYHQQYLVKNPTRVCAVHATGVRCQ